MKLREFGVSSLKDEYVCTCQVCVVHAKKMKARENQKRQRCVCCRETPPLTPFSSVLNSELFWEATFIFSFFAAKDLPPLFTSRL